MHALPLEAADRLYPGDEPAVDLDVIPTADSYHEPNASPCLARARHSANGLSHAGEALQQQPETSMSDHTARAARNQENSLAAFFAKKAEFDALIAELTQASKDHFGATPEATLWCEASWLEDANKKLQDIADQHFRRGEYDV